MPGRGPDSGEELGPQIAGPDRRGERYDGVSNFKIQIKVLLIFSFFRTTRVNACKVYLPIFRLIDRADFLFFLKGSPQFSPIGGVALF